MVPKYLYHYTTKESLEAILSNKTIRFTRLDLLNDINEGYFNDELNPNLYHFVTNFMYASSWTNLSEENKEMWHLYSRDKGVRIKLKSNMFNNIIEFKNVDGLSIPVQKIEKRYIKITDEIETSFSAINGPYSIDYKGGLNDVHNNAYNITLEKCSNGKQVPFKNIVFDYIGKEKLKKWSYEKEYRFKINLLVAIHGAFNLFIENPSFKYKTPEHIDIPLITNIEEVMISSLYDDTAYKRYVQFLQSIGYTGKICMSELNLK